ncbi:ABC transporter substrate-binding protein [Candidatus Hepatincolaceae symbiont of Richtersius coronifer]
MQVKTPLKIFFIVICFNTLIVINLCANVRIHTQIKPAVTEQCFSYYSRSGKPLYQKNFLHFNYINPTAKKGGELKLATIGSFNSFMPYALVGLLPKDYFILYYDSLMYAPLDDLSTFYPLLAQKYCMQYDQNTTETLLTFYLNPEARWHQSLNTSTFDKNQNLKITAYDVKFTFDTLRFNSIPYYKAAFANIKDIKIINDSTISFKILGDYKNLLAGILSMPIIAKDNTKGNIPKGSGPYKILEVKLGKKIVFIKDPNYWGKHLPVRKGYFNFDLIQYLYLKDSSQARSLLFQGEINLIQSSIKEWNNYYNPKRLAKYNLAKLGLNHNRIPKFNALFINTRNPSLKDVNVRKALYYAYDFEKINHQIFANAYPRQSGLFDNTDFQGHYPLTHTQDKLNLSQDDFYVPQNVADIDIRKHLALADKFLEKADFYFKNGKRQHKDTNQVLEINFLFKDNQAADMNLDFFQNLEKLGIKVRIKVANNIQYHLLKNNFKFDIIQESYLFSHPPTHELYDYFSSDQKDIRGSYNFSGLADQVVDQLIEKIRFSKFSNNTQKSENELKSLLSLLDGTIKEKYIYIPLQRETLSHYIYSDIFITQDSKYNIGLEVFIWSIK